MVNIKFTLNNESLVVLNLVILKNRMPKNMEEK